MTTMQLLWKITINILDCHGDAIQHFTMRRMEECLTNGDVESFLLWESLQNVINCLRNSAFQAADTLH